jgi:hypothetical protein
MAAYADGTNILITDKDEYELTLKVNCAVTQLKAWFSKNELLPSTGKLCALAFHPRQ